MSADAYATGLLVMGTEEAKAFAKQHNLAVMLVYKTDDGFEEYVSNAFKPLLSEQK
jgi:thiamine biosynthesis lipoprotein